MIKNSINLLYKRLEKSKLISLSQESLNDIVMQMDLKDLVKKRNFEKIVAIQSIFDKRSLKDEKSKIHLDILQLLYARILSQSNSKKTCYISLILDQLKRDSKRFSEAIQDLVIADAKSSQRFAVLTNKIAERLDSLDGNVLNAYLQNAMNSGNIELDTKLGNKSLRDILHNNPKVTLSTQFIASKLYSYPLPEIKSFYKRRGDELRGFRLINIILGIGSLIAFIGLISGIVIANMLLAIGSLFLFISFWGAGHFNKSMHDLQMREITKVKGKAYLTSDPKIVVNDSKKSKKVKKITMLRELIRANHSEFEKNLAKYEKSMLKNARKVCN